MNKSTYFLYGVTLFITACSTRPLPDDFAQATTLAIVERIRCETLGAIIIQVANRLRHTDGLPEAEVLYSRLVERVERGEIQASADDVERVLTVLERAGAQEQINNLLLYENYVIGYDFQFDISENNNNTGSLGFVLPIPSGTFGLSVGGGLNRTRGAKRTFKIIESFQRYLALGESGKCAQNNFEENQIYPITGNIGINEILTTYFSLENDYDELKDFSDELKFTTVFNGSANPSITLIPMGGDLDLTGASLGSSHTRTDIHQVTITISPPKEGQPDTQGAFDTLRRRELLEAEEGR